MFQRTQILENLTELDFELYKKINRLVMSFEERRQNLPEEELFWVNCHSFARAVVSYVQELMFVDGYYLGLGVNEGKYVLRKVEHSWLVTPDNAIIETCSMGFLSALPVLIPTKGIYAHTGAGYYKTSEEIAKEIRKKVLTVKIKESVLRSKELLRVCI